ncbi:ArsR family transcriptional regulator [Knoellia sinensis KCTC 19936]|uniref:ArsR family transcriptional regulator n=1 Tax=Knoellia sinensis KCTC 19936 TaxID=1385520 RepID=A0A0A0JGM4_9MICO|nr:metalloregulator ArsR/SmtB family transcription factor [Knoellia sinensis]KGN34776.1 ArsR family transcriptional regulator [Knoellia sinensis KCTC 19936]
MTDALSTTFAALADPTRRAILARLSSGDATVGELAEPFELSLPAISKHLTVLEKAGLITKSRDGQRRHCRISVAPLKDATSWLELYRQHWEQQFDNLGDYLATIHEPPADGRGTRSTAPKENPS